MIISFDYSLQILWFTILKIVLSTEIYGESIRMTDESFIFFSFIRSLTMEKNITFMKILSEVCQISVELMYHTMVQRKKVYIGFFFSSFA